jgi:hypothetical protein
MTAPPFYTHKGWIGLCPVYIANRHSASPDIKPRYPLTEWMLYLSLWLFDLFGPMTGSDNGSIPIRITGKAKP